MSSSTTTMDDAAFKALANQWLLRALAEKWFTEPELRARMRADPEGTISLVGLTLTDEQRAFLKNIKWELSEDELHTLFYSAAGSVNL